ncbi:MAG: nucleotidyl transferase AbiEii/AbiGii toxin family protein [Microthrixaceae bacterium]|jgi:predicted nucleotidyltransferase
MELNRDFQEFLQSFVTHEVRFLIVGGYALAAHGHPRYTKDLDVWVWADPSNSPRIIDALEVFGFGDLDLSASDFEQAGVVVQLGREPQRIDILTFATGLEFPDAYERRMLVELGGIEVPFVSLEDLRVNKRAAGRLRDLADLEDLPPVD